MFHVDGQMDRNKQAVLDPNRILTYGLSKFLVKTLIQSLYIHTFTGVTVHSIITNRIDLLDYRLIIPHYSLHSDGVPVNFVSHFEYMSVHCLLQLTFLPKQVFVSKHKYPSTEYNLCCNKKDSHLLLTTCLSSTFFTGMAIY